MFYFSGQASDGTHGMREMPVRHVEWDPDGTTGRAKPAGIGVAYLGATSADVGASGRDDGWTARGARGGAGLAAVAWLG